MKGIDISKYQAGIDLNNIKNNGYDFVIIRAGYTGWGDGESKAKDPNFEEFYSKAKSAGLGVGAYYFTIATSYQEGVDEANWLYNNCLKGKQFDYPIYIDVEDDTGGKQYLRKAGKDATTQGIKGFCETMENLGYYVGIYASDISGFKDMMNIDELKDYDKWVARYGKKPEYVTEYGMWQTTSSGKVNGYNGNLDLNEAYKDYPSIIKSNGLNGYSKDGTSSNIHQINSSADQILYKGSKVKFNGIFKVDILKSPISSNLFGCTALTGISFNDYYNEKCKSYHWLPTEPFTECDVNGNPTKDQVLGGGLSYVKNDNVYTVQDIDIPTNSAKLNINGRYVWVFSKYLKEVSNN